jgi:hypothetical protein
VFIVAAIPLGLAVGWLLGGRLDGLATVHLRLVPVAFAALLTQLVLFSPISDAVPSEAGRWIYVLSTAAVLVVVLANLRLAGAALIALGAAANLAAIVANGGAMPADPAALAAAGIVLDQPANSIVVSSPALAPLTDVFALPRALPFANVFSVGDVLIALGVVVAIAVAMRNGRTRTVASAAPPGE